MPVLDNAERAVSGTCSFWGASHLLHFPVDPERASIRTGLSCQAAGRIALVKNILVEIYAYVTDKSYQIEDVSHERDITSKDGRRHFIDDSCMNSTKSIFCPKQSKYAR